MLIKILLGFVDVPTWPCFRPFNKSPRDSNRDLHTCSYSISSFVHVETVFCGPWSECVRPDHLSWRPVTSLTKLGWSNSCPTVIVHLDHPHTRKAIGLCSAGASPAPSALQLPTLLRKVAQHRHTCERRLSPHLIASSPPERRRNDALRYALPVYNSSSHMAMREMTTRILVVAGCVRSLITRRHAHMLTEAMTIWCLFPWNMNKRTNIALLLGRNDQRCTSTYVARLSRSALLHQLSNTTDLMLLC